MKVALIGCGNIGCEIAEFIVNRPRLTLYSVTDIDRSNIEKVKKIAPYTKVRTLDKAILESELIIEAANKDVVKQILEDKKLDTKNKKLLVMSTGGLIENTKLLDKLFYCEVHIPSGAIAGLDAIQAVAEELEEVTLTTTKSPESLEGSPFVLANNIKLKSFKTKKSIFKGGLKEAIKGFPKNINVAASLYMASRFDNIGIEIIADPSTQFNTHRITCKGKFGEFSIQTINYPSKNPKTSYLAIQSAISVLKNITTNIKVGF